MYLSKVKMSFFRWNKDLKKIMSTVSFSNIATFLGRPVQTEATQVSADAIWIGWLKTGKV